MTTEAQTKKKSNRAIQRTHATYQKKSEISEALNLVRPYLNESTYKFLSHFLYTNGSGVTQIKIAEWCKKVGVSLGNYTKTVKREIETTFGQALIITTKAPMKYDAKRKKKVKASEFKSLQPLSIIKILVRKKEQEERLELEGYWSQFEIESEIESEIEGEIESNEQIPCESKSEEPFLEQQNKSFRENPLENNININNNKSIIEADSLSSKKVKKYRLKKEVKAILNQDILKALNEEQKQEFGNRIQIALKKTGANIKDEGIQNTLFQACYSFVMYYEKHRDSINEDYYGALYVCIENAIYDYFIGLEQEEEEEFDEYEEQEDYEYLDDIGEYENEGKHGYNGEYYQQNKKREALKLQHKQAIHEQRQAFLEMAIARELNELGVF